jgi:hypothetical protein
MKIRGASEPSALATQTFEEPLPAVSLGSE